MSGHSDTSLGVYGESGSGQGILGLALATTPNPSVTTTGVTGKSANDAGTFGWNTWNGTGTAPGNAVGVYGLSTYAAGVSSKSPNASGILGVTAGNTQAAINGASFADTSYSALGSIQGVLGQSGSSFGVEDSSASSAGVVGQSGSGYGVYALSGSNHAVLGISARGNGVVGYATAATLSGIVGVANGSGALAATFIGPVSVQGTLTATAPVANGTHSLVGTSGVAGYGAVFGQTNVAGGVGVYGYVNPSVGPANATAGFFNGNLVVTGGTKNAAVPHPDGSHRLLYCVEATEAWFEDFGEGTLAGGTVTVALDGDFAAVVDTSTLYVFLTPHVAGNALAVTARSATGFTVTEGNGGKSSGGFTYRVVAKRKDVASPRLAKITLPSVAVVIPPNVAPLAAPPPAPPVPAIPKVPHHAEEDTPPVKTTGAAPGSTEVAATEDGQSALLSMTRL